MNVATIVTAGERDALALEEAWSGRVWSHGDLRRAAGSVQATLAAHDVDVGDRVAVLAGNGLELFSAWLGTTARGASVTTVNLLLGPVETAAILDNLDPAVVLALPEHEERALAGAGGRRVLDLVEASSDRDAPFAPVERAPGDAAAVGYTSGTTGPLPKGAVLSHGVLAGMIESTAAGLGLEAGDPILAFLPQFQLPAMMCSPATALALGGSCLLFERLDVPGVADAVRERGIRYFSSVPTALYDLVVHGEGQALRFESLRVVTVGGAPVPPALRERARAVGIPAATVYGCTETAGGVAVERIDGSEGPGSCGPPVPGVRVTVRDEASAECPPGVDGEVCVEASRALTEYWRNPEATAAALRDGWFHTGDVGRFDDQGRLHVVDRIKDIIIRGGFNISPAEVERALVARTDVAEAAVLGRPDERLGEVPVAFVVAASGASLDPDELRAFARGELGPFKTPAAVEVVDASFFPRTALGKVQKVALAQRLGWR
ncbi:MAG: AMP-binding protein [Acidimicrobiia bacterium]|nr:AMP-binding protein [Acidimicrobiia bacterium]